MLTAEEQDKVIEDLLADDQIQNESDVNAIEKFATRKASYRWWRDVRMYLLIAVIALILLCCPGLEIANQLHISFGL